MLASHARCSDLLWHCREVGRLHPHSPCVIAVILDMPTMLPKYVTVHSRTRWVLTRTQLAIASRLRSVFSVYVWSCGEPCRQATKSAVSVAAAAVPAAPMPFISCHWWLSTDASAVMSNRWRDAQHQDPEFLTQPIYNFGVTDGPSLEGRTH